MTTVVQTSYRPYQRVGLVGMPADGTMASDDTRIVEPAGGIAFGLAVGQGTTERGCVLGGSATSFLGISMIDVTLVRSPIDPLGNTLAALDTYPQYANCAIRSRGHIWVLAGANVAAGDAAYFSATTGALSGSTGAAATGSVSFSTNPTDGQTVVLNGTTVTFKNTPGAGQVQIGATLYDTINNLVALVNGSADVNLTLLKLASGDGSQQTPVTGAANTVLVASKAAGTAGNAYTLAAGTSGATVSGGTLAGGAAAGIAIPSGYWLSAAVAGQLAKVSLAIQR